jgi:hypothetical protein
MTIEIEAGASQSEFSMKPLVVHAFFGGQHWNGTIHDRSRFGAAGAVAEEATSFSKETPSLSLRLRSVQAVEGLANAARTKSNSIRVRSICVRF